MKNILDASVHFFSNLRSNLLSDLALLNISLSGEDLFIKITSTENVYSLANYVEKSMVFMKDLPV